MENNKLNYTYDNVIQIDDATESRRFIANVFLWMFVALALSAAFAYEFAVNDSLRALLYDPQTGHSTGLGVAAIFAPFAFILAISFGLNKIAYPLLVLLFVAFAAIMGISLSYVLLIYTASSVVGVFITASLLFGVMAIAGYTTHTDLTKFGSLMMMGLIGVVIASLVNAFLLHSAAMDYVVSFVGVAVFIGLTAYDVQKLKQIGASESIDGVLKSKLGLVGALTLYLDFVNLFLMLLRLFGGRRR